MSCLSLPTCRVPTIDARCGIGGGVARSLNVSKVFIDHKYEDYPMVKCAPLLKPLIPLRVLPFSCGVEEVQDNSCSLYGAECPLCLCELLLLATSPSCSFSSFPSIYLLIFSHCEVETTSFPAWFQSDQRIKTTDIFLFLEIKLQLPF